MQVNRAPRVNMIALSNRIRPLDNETAVARRHILGVRSRLVRSFDVSRTLQIGSHARGTAIHMHSDLDLLVVLRKNEAKWAGALVSSGTLLGRVLDDLKIRYPNTVIRRDAQAAVLGFSNGARSLDVVPAFFQSFHQSRPVYLIPDGEGEWRETSPEVHDRFFGKANTRSGGKLCKTAQLIKWWKHSREQKIPLSSFHTDLLLSSSQICEGMRSYTQILHDFFRLLRDRECRPLRDPCGIAGNVSAGRTLIQTETLLNAVDYAYSHSYSALVAENARDYVEANRQWNIVFNGYF